MPPRPENTWVIGDAVAETLTRAGRAIATTDTMTGIVASVTLIARVATSVTIGTVIITAGTAGTGTGATDAARRLARGTRRSTEGAEATPEALRGVAVPDLLGIMMRRLPAPCLLMATATLAGEATVR